MDKGSHVMRMKRTLVIASVLAITACGDADVGEESGGETAATNTDIGKIVEAKAATPYHQDAMAEAELGADLQASEVGEITFASGDERKRSLARMEMVKQARARRLQQEAAQ